MAAIVAAILFTAVYIGALALAGASVGAENPQGAPTGVTGPANPLPRPCKTVTAKTFNRYVRKLDRITGKRHHKASRKVCKARFYKLKRAIRAAKHRCIDTAMTVTASVYGTTPYDDNGMGYRGDHLFDYADSFAELGWGHALGGLPLHAKRWIKSGPFVRRGTKRDIGPTHPGLNGTKRAIDLHAPLARALRVSGLKIVIVSRTNCWA